MTIPLDIVPAWACVALHGCPEPFIHSGTVRSLRADSQECLGNAYARENETLRQGWKRAYRDGWRCQRVIVEQLIITE